MMKKRFLSILLSLCMVLALFPVTVFAEEGTQEAPVCTCETACGAETMNAECMVCGAEGASPESCGKYEAPAAEPEDEPEAEPVKEPEEEPRKEPQEASQEPTPAEQVQALINALPAAEAITAENRGSVEAQLTAIDLAKASLSEAELAALDFTGYDAAIAALNALDGMTGAEAPEPVDDTDDLQSLLNNPTAGKPVTLNKDYTITKTLQVNVDVTLDLNGHVIEMTETDTMIQVNAGKSLTLMDSQPKATHTDDSLPAGGLLSRPTLQADGKWFTSGVIVNGSLTMTGGTIYIHRYDDYGGGVYVGSSGSFTMTGGAIYGSLAGSGGGGVYVSGGRFTMNGGAIHDCKASHNGGGVYVVSDGSFTINDGAIYGCIAGMDGGGVCVSGGSFTMTGGAIYGCESYMHGGGVGIYGYSFTMTGGAIYDCSADNSLCQAIRAYADAKIYANGGTIEGTVHSLGQIQNTATSGCTRFYGEVMNYGTISGGIYYGGIMENFGAVSKPYYTVSFDLNGGSGSVPTQWFVNIDTAPALKPANPTKEGYTFTGWYKGDTPYDFTKPVKENITLTAQWVVSSISVDTEAELQEALDHGIPSIQLLGDIRLTSMLDLSDKAVTLDLNGHTLKGSIKLADSSAAPESSLTLIDSDPAGGGVLDGKIELTNGSNGSASHLYANGGTITGAVSLNSYVAKLFCTSDTPTAIKGNAGNYGEIHGGIFYAGVKTESIKENTVTFMRNGSRYALEVVAEGSKVVAPIEPAAPEGMVFTGWYTDEALTQRYEFGGALPGSITLYAGYMPVTYTVTYDPGAYGKGSIDADTKIHDVNLTLSSKTFTRKYYVQTGWSETDGGTKAYDLGGIYSANADVTLYPVWEEKIVTVTAPFTITVALGDAGVPGETDFELAVIDGGGNELFFEDVEVTGTIVTTDGAGSYDGAITFTGPLKELNAMLLEGAFVWQYDDEEEGWTYDDTVWGLGLYQENDVYGVRIFRTVCEEDGEYNLDFDSGTFDRMRFTNTYTAHAYELKFDENNHWDECSGCHDQQNGEPHRFGDWKVTKKATETTKGEKERTCSVCDYTETKEIPKLSGKYSPQTGDNSNLTLWIVLFAASTGVVIGTGVYSLRRKNSRRK